MIVRSGWSRLVAVVVASTLVAAALAACSGSGGSSGDRAPTDAEVRTVMAQHARGVLNHSRSAFLSAIDSQRTTADFRSAQDAEYDNLVTVPLRTWSYAIGPAVTQSDVQAAVRKTDGRSARVVRLELHYALRGVDAVPVQHDLWWTFVRRNGRVVALSDDDLARSGGVSWAGPWDFGPMTTVSGRSSVVFGRADQGAALAAIAATVDQAVPAVTAVWGTNWTRRVAVIVPATSAAFAAALGGPDTQDAETQGPDTPDAGNDFAALAVTAGQDPATNDELEQRLVIDPAGFAKLSAVGRTITVTHEVTHIASAESTTEASPRWLVEGFADYVGNLHSGQPVRQVAAELQVQVRKGHSPTALPTDAEIDSPTTAASAYEQAWLACRLIAARAGQAGLVRFYRQVGAAPTASDAAVTAGLRSVLHESVAAFTAQWRASVQAQLR